MVRFIIGDGKFLKPLYIVKHGRGLPSPLFPILLTCPPPLFFQFVSPSPYTSLLRPTPIPNVLSVVLFLLLNG